MESSFNITLQELNEQFKLVYEQVYETEDKLDAVFQKTACVLTRFQPEHLHSLEDQESSGNTINTIGWENFLRYCEPVKTRLAGNWWRLNSAVRQKALKQLDTRENMIRALETNQQRPPEITQTLFEAILYRREYILPVNIKHLSREELVALSGIFDWLKGILDVEEEANAIQQALPLADLLAPMRRLVSAGFVGREKELDKLTTYLTKILYGEENIINQINQAQLKTGTQQASGQRRHELETEIGRYYTLSQLRSIFYQAFGERLESDIDINRGYKFILFDLMDWLESDPSKLTHFLLNLRVIITDPNSRLKILVDNYLGMPAPDPYEALVAYGEPIVDRMDFRNKLKQLFHKGYNEVSLYKALLVSGPRQSGRSFLGYLIRAVTEYESVQMVQLNLIDSSLDNLIQRLAIVLSLPQEKLPVFETTLSAHIRKFVFALEQHLKEQALHSPDKPTTWCLVFDDYDQEQLYSEVRSLVDELVMYAVSNSELNLWVIVLGYNNLPARLNHNRVLIAHLEPINKVDVRNFLNAIATKEGRDYTPEQLNALGDAVLAGVESRPLDSEGIRIVNSRLRQLLNPTLSPLLIYGPGGVGKSTLLAKFILDTVDNKNANPALFVYLDIDRPVLNLEQPVSFLIEAARQLSIQVPASKKRLFSFIDDARQDRSSIDVGNEFAAIVRFINKHILFVVDTFEEAQFLGRGVADQLWNVLYTMQKSALNLRIVVAGRALVTVENPPTQAIELKELSRPEAEFLLKNSITHTETDMDKDRLKSILDKIISTVGLNPLSLRLAAAIVKEQGVETLTNDKDQKWLVSMRAEVIQARLYGRILAHIHDSDVQKLAYPGLIVRRITPDIIRKVLAEPCGLKAMNRKKAKELFDKLSKEVALVEQDPEDRQALLHRQDVRRIMLLDLNEEVSEEKLHSIHDRAVGFYSKQTDDVSRAEEIYHRIWRGDSSAELENRWHLSLKSRLGKALEELPVKGRIWLSGKLGVTPNADLLKQANLEEWEGITAQAAQRYLQDGNAQEALLALRERQERSPTSPLYRIELEALHMQGLFTEASNLVEVVLASVKNNPFTNRSFIRELLLQATLIKEAEGKLNEALSYIREAEKMLGSQPEAIEVLRVLVVYIRLLRKLGYGWDQERSGLIDRSKQWLEQDSVLNSVRNYPALLRELTAEVGKIMPELLQYAIDTLGIDISTERQVDTLSKALIAWNGKTIQAERHAESGELVERAGLADSSKESWADFLYKKSSDAIKVSIQHWRSEIADNKQKEKAKNEFDNELVNIYRETVDSSITRAVHNLPVPSYSIYGSLFGRDRESDRILEALASRYPLISIEGLAGVGKTSLALDVAYSCFRQPAKNKSRYVTFDYIIWVSAKDFPNQESWLVDVLHTIAQVMGFPSIAQVSKPLEWKIWEIHELLQKSSTLIIIDNFETINDPDLEAWLTEVPAPSKVIVTSRRWQSLRGLPINLEGLEQKDALKLIRRHCNALGLPLIGKKTDSELLPLATYTGGNPLAIILALGTLKGQKAKKLSYEELISGLKQNNRNGQIDKVFAYLYSESWKHLSSKARKVILTVHLFVSVDSINKECLQIASGIKRTEDFNQAINELSDLRLVQIHASIGDLRYKVHPITYAFVKARLERDQKFEESTRSRWSNYFLDFVRTHVKREIPDKPYWNALVSDNMQNIDKEWQSINEVMKWADQKGHDEIFMQLVLLLVHYLDSRFFNLQRMTYVKKAIELSKKMKLIEEQALLQLDALGWTYIEEDDLDKATEQIMFGLATAEKLQDSHERTDLIALGYAWQARVKIEQRAGHFQEARQLIGEALLRVERCSPWIRARIYMAAGDIALKENRSEDALLFYKKQDHSMAEYGGEGHRYQVLSRLGLAYIGSGDLKSAEEKFKELYSITSVPIGILYANYGLALIAYKRGQKKETPRLVEDMREALYRKTTSKVLLKFTNELFDEMKER